MRTLQKTYSLDVLLLCLLAIFIPLESEIKLFVVGIFCLCWFALRYKEKPHFKDWGHYDSLLLLCMIFPLTAVFSGFENMIWKSVLNQFAVAEKFVCIVDDSKVVKTLGNFPLPVEVIPMARSYVSREIIKMGGRPEVRI
jgi:hypothetical protein